MTKKAHVAIVDDNSPFTANLRAFLSSRGYDARCYAHERDLLASVRQHGAPDVVLVDGVVNGLERLATLKALKASYPLAETIVLSGGSQASPSVEADRLGPWNYVVKPDGRERLEGSALDEAIERAIERGRGSSPTSTFEAPCGDDGEGCVWGAGDRMRALNQTIDQIADSDVTVLVRGESGVGKGFVARALHRRSKRHAAPFVNVNCAALPGELLESELFGHERGAFTGAANTRIGKFEQADGGTLILDEIGEMKPALQAKLLHVLQDGDFTKLGSNKRVHVDVRMVAATNRNLEQMLISGDFREDLYYRLEVIELTVPPLRERRDEIPALIEFSLRRSSRLYRRPIRPVSAELRQLFAEYDWPGNIRELDNMIKRIVVLQDEQHVIREIQRKVHTPEPAAVESTATSGAESSIARPSSTDMLSGLEWAREDATLGSGGPEQETGLVAVAKAAALRAERVVILQTLTQVNWNRRKAAQMLGVSYKTLLKKIKECGLSRG
jgi:two-component system response regulator AtoC